jgi:hypothetical protein
MDPSLYFHPFYVKKMFCFRKQGCECVVVDLSLRDLKGKQNAELEKLALQIAIQLLLVDLYDLAQQFAHIYDHSNCT